LKGTLTVVPADGAPVSQPLDLAPASASAVALSTMLKAPWVAALVDVDGGGAVVDQFVSGPVDNETAACSTTASTRWYFAAGSTAKDAVQTLALYNPFPDDAIVDLAFATGEGRRVPGDFQGIVVGAGKVAAVDVGAHLRRQDVVSTEVRARAGGVVAGQMVVRTAPGEAGLSYTVGAPALGGEWYFPDGIVSAGVAERFEIFNPGDSEARVDIELALAEGDAEPFELTVPAQGRVTLDMGAESRVPKDVAHAAVARSINDVPVVVQRTLISTTPRVGRVDGLGARHPARRWALAAGSATEQVDEWVVVLNASAARAVVSVAALADGQRVAVEGLQGVVVPAGKRMAFRLGDHIKRASLPVVVTSEGADVVVERALFMAGAIGFASSMGVPLS
jgi:hypothetical protein